MIYALNSGTGAFEKTAVFFQILAAAFPFVTGVVCVVTAEQEETAGHVQNLLTLPCRLQVILSKYLILICGALAAVLLSTFIYCAFLSWHTADIQLSYKTLVIQPIVLWLGSLVLYSIHLFTAFRFGKNLCIGLGAAGSLLAALMQTGLGTGLWYKIPYGWASHFVTFAMNTSARSGVPDSRELKTAVVSCTLITLVSIILLFIWFSRYEGKHTVD